MFPFSLLIFIRELTKSQIEPLRNNVARPKECNTNHLMSIRLLSCTIRALVLCWSYKRDLITNYTLCRKEIGALQAENYSLERQLFSYQKSLAYAHSSSHASGSTSGAAPGGSRTGLNSADDEPQTYDCPASNHRPFLDRSVSTETEYAWRAKKRRYIIINPSIMMDRQESEEDRMVLTVKFPIILQSLPQFFFPSLTSNSQPSGWVKR